MFSWLTGGGGISSAPQTSGCRAFRALRVEGLGIEGLGFGALSSEFRAFRVEGGGCREGTESIPKP